MDLEAIETELKKRFVVPYDWKGMKQTNERDRKTDFIYTIKKFDDVIEQINLYKELPEYELMKNYALNRWYNFHSAKAVESIFNNLPNVKPALNKKDRLVDFEIKGIRFDLKTTTLPRGFKKNIAEAKEHKKELIEWLYANQSNEKRQHYANRLFIVLYNPNKEHWKLKAELRWLKDIIENYMNDFDVNTLERVKFESGKEALSDVIWGVF